MRSWRAVLQVAYICGVIGLCACRGTGPGPALPPVEPTPTDSHSENEAPQGFAALVTAAGVELTWETRSDTLHYLIHNAETRLLLATVEGGAARWVDPDSDFLVRRYKITRVGRGGGRSNSAEADALQSPPVAESAGPMLWRFAGGDAGATSSTTAPGPSRPAVLSNTPMPSGRNAPLAVLANGSLLTVTESWDGRRLARVGADGALRWQLEGGGYTMLDDGQGAVYFEAAGRYLLAVDGTVREFPPGIGGTALGLTPARLYIDSGSASNMLEAYSLDGELLWSYEAGSEIHLLRASSDGNLRLRTEAGVVALDATGNELWRVALDAPLNNQADLLVGPDGLAYTSVRAGGIAAVPADGAQPTVYNSAADVLLRALRDDRLYCIERDSAGATNLAAFRTDLTKAWGLPFHDPYGNVVADGRGWAYFTTDDGVLHAVDSSGTAKWTLQLAGRADLAWGANGVLIAFDGAQVTRIGNLESNELAAPQGLAASRGAYYGAVRLDWQPVDGAESYTVLRSNSIVATGITDTSWVDQDAEPGTAYGYAVAAVAHDLTGPPAAAVTGIARAAPAGPAQWATEHHDAGNTRRGAGIGPAAGAIRWTSDTGLELSYAATILLTDTGSPLVGTSAGLAAFSTTGALQWKLAGATSSRPLLGPDHLLHSGTNTFGLFGAAPQDYYFPQRDFATATEQLLYRSQRNDETGPVYDSLVEVHDPGGLQAQWSVDGLTAIEAVRPDGSVLLTQSGIESTPGYYSQFEHLDCYAPNGDLRWSFAPETTVIQQDQLTGLYISHVLATGDGGAYVLGTLQLPAGFDGPRSVSNDPPEPVYLPRIWALDATGRLLWVSAAEKLDTRASPALGTADCLWLGGEPGSFDYGVARLARDGTLTWMYEFPDYSYLRAVSLVTDSAGNAYIGAVDDARTEGAVLSLDQGGELRWELKRYGLLPERDAMALAADGTLYVASESDELYAIGP